MPEWLVGTLHHRTKHLHVYAYRQLVFKIYHSTSFYSSERFCQNIILFFQAIYPRVSDGNAGHYQFPKAIYLNLSEVREEAYSHPGFYKCHRERIFIFHKYFPRLNYDADNPVNMLCASSTRMV